VGGICEIAVKIGSGAMIYIPKLKIGSGFEKLLRGVHRHTDSMEII
jgi:hypothetical protein